MTAPFAILSKPLGHPVQSLTVLCALWKSFLLLIAAASPGPGYDTSSLLIQLPRNAAAANFTGLVTGYFGDLFEVLPLVAGKLTRWDAIYYTKLAQRGYVFEQEWAFGWGLTRLVGFSSALLKKAGGVSDYDFIESLVGIAISHVAHWLSVLALYALARAISPAGQDRKLALITAALHVFSPAGLFLSAPYGESLFALLSFAGYLLFARAFDVEQHNVRSAVFLITSGLLFGISTTIRSNGLLNGILFLEEAARLAIAFRNPSWRIFCRLAVVVVGGVCIACGLILPQAIAWLEYCGPTTHEGEPREWCQRAIPSIYSFVQAHYWNVGFLRYWTVSNIPLFMLATPMLIIMIISAWSTINTKPSGSSVTKPGLVLTSPSAGQQDIDRSRRLLRSLAIPQLIIALLAITNYHVQIITRISSAYPVWYFWLASQIVGAGRTNVPLKRKNNGTSVDSRPQGQMVIVRFMVIYAVVQGGLFASFLPPA